MCVCVSAALFSHLPQLRGKQATSASLGQQNKSLQMHRGREGKKECVLCGDECESVSHTLWDCSAYTSIRAQFLLKLKASLGGS